MTHLLNTRGAGRQLAAVVGMAALCGGATFAEAGFTLTTAAVWMNAPRGSDRPFAVGDIFVTGEFGRFSDISPDSPDDVVIHSEDLLSYRYTMDGTVIAASENTVVYGGTFDIFIVLRPFDIRVADVSFGTFLITADFQSPTYALMSGTLTQDPSHEPGESGLPDLSYGGSPITYSGTYQETVVGVGGLMDGEMRQNAVPAPGTVGSLLLAGLALSRRRRR